MEQVIERKSFLFAVRIVKLYKHLAAGKKEYVISKQLLRAGTSIGANITEAEQAQSRADFISKMNIALKEAVETNYWLRLLQASEYLSDTEFTSIYSDCQEIEKCCQQSLKHLNNKTVDRGQWIVMYIRKIINYQLSTVN